MIDKTCESAPSKLARKLGTRLVERCNELARYSEEPGRLTRTFASPPFREVHDTVAQWMTAAGMEWRIDPACNLIGRWPGPPGGGSLLIGSHLDTVPDAGRYDGILGVLLGLATVEALQARSRSLPFSLEVVGFSDEEGARFATPYVGSRALSGGLNEDLLKRRDKLGVSLRQAIRDFGQDPSQIPQASYRGADVLGYFEVHIEQGPVLEEAGLPVGVVEAIVGQTWARVRFKGRPGHAGTVPMDQRRDALVAAARWIAEVEERGFQDPGLVATVGQMEVRPGGINVIPGDVRLSLDVRHQDDATRQRAVEDLLERGRTLAAERGLRFEVERQEGEAAVATDSALTAGLCRAVESRGLEVHRMASGAGHDGVVLSTVMPISMLFVRCLKGISHHPDESVEPADVATALDVTLAFVADLAKNAHASPGAP